MSTVSFAPITGRKASYYPVFLEGIIIGAGYAYFPDIGNSQVTCTINNDLQVGDLQGK